MAENRTSFLFKKAVISSLNNGEPLWEEESIAVGSHFKVQTLDGTSSVLVFDVLHTALNKEGHVLHTAPQHRGSCVTQP